MVKYSISFWFVMTYKDVSFT